MVRFVGLLMFLVACHSFTENAPREGAEQWFDWECDGSTLIVRDASSPVEPVIEGGCAN